MKQLLVFHQLQDAARNKFTKCEHIDIDWGVAAIEQEEDIYHTPGVLQGGGMKRSETADNLSSNGSSGSVTGRSAKPHHKALSTPVLEGKRYVI